MSFTPETVKEIARHIAAGKSFRAIGCLPDMPSRSTMQRAYTSDPEFKLIVDNAKNCQLPRVPVGPTLERQRKGDVVWEAVDRSLAGNVIQTRARATVSSRLDWYLDRESITPDMHRAGERMAQIMFHAGKSPNVCVMFRERVSGLSRKDDSLLDKSAAQIALEKALAVLDSNERDAIWDVCALDNFAGNVKFFRMGLRALVVHFRIMSDNGDSIS